MAVAPAISLGITLKLFAEDKNDSAAQICDHVIGDFRNLEEVLKFARDCDVVTVEHGLIPLSIIKGLEAEGIRVYPRSLPLELIGAEIQTIEELNSEIPFNKLFGKIKTNLNNRNKSPGSHGI